MTGKEKIEYVVTTIDNAFKRLVSGNTVIISSNELAGYGIGIEELQDILTTLSQLESYVTYTSSPLYKSESDIDPYTLHEVTEAVMASDGPSESILLTHVHLQKPGWPNGRRAFLSARGSVSKYLLTPPSTPVTTSM